MILARHTALTLLFGAAILGCKEGDNKSSPLRLESPISVVHLPPKGSPLKESPYPHMWYYRTEVRNDSDRELRVIWFEGYLEIDGVWYPGNALGKVLRSKEFSLWHTEGDPIVDGTLSPGDIAVCDVNWHGSQTDSAPRTKWAYIAVDEFGFDYFVESEVPSNVLKHVHQDLSSVEDPTSRPKEPQQAEPQPKSEERSR